MANSFSPRLLNWVEPYEIVGINKTLFYTEVNSELKVGDKVFIVNGNYDSDKLIKKNKYSKGVDGYEVLFIDKCRIVLDINYNGILPYNDLPDSEFVKITWVKTQEEFNWVNKKINSNFDYEFTENNGNIIYVDSELFNITDTWGQSDGITQSGFYVKGNSTEWINISDDFMSGSYSIAGSQSRIKIKRGTFEYNNFEFKEGFIYNWGIGEENDGVGSTSSEWRVDVEYHRPIIGKTNFRGGNFNGEFNDGIYGRQDNKVTWSGEGTFNNGTLLNTYWKQGVMNVKQTDIESYVAELEDVENGLPYQNITQVNNNGYGFNYIIDSEFENSILNGGILINSKIGNSSTYSVVENHILEQPVVYRNIVNNALLKNCKLTDTILNLSEIKNTISDNIKVNNSKSVNSNYTRTVIENSSYISDDIIKIESYEINENFNNFNKKRLRLKIDREGFNRISIGDSFFIKGMRYNDEELLNVFDKKFRIGVWNEYDNLKEQTNEYVVYLTQESNEYFLDIFTDSLPENLNIKNAYLLDSNFESGIFERSNWNSGRNINYSNDLCITDDNVEGNYNIELINGDLIINTRFDLSKPEFKQDIKEGDVYFLNAVNYNLDGVVNDIQITQAGSGYVSSQLEVETIDGDGLILNVATGSSGEIITTTISNAGGGYNLGTYSILGGDNNAIIEITNVITLEYTLDDSYKVISVSNNEIVLREVVNPGLNQIQSGGTFITNDAFNRFGYLHPVKFNKSKIKSGLLRRAYLKECFIENESYNTDDIDFNVLSNVKSLLISDVIFKNNTNILSKATYMNSSFVGGSDQWLDGIGYNLIWKDGDFDKGVIKNSNWINGTFSGGLFYNSRSFNGGTGSNGYNVFNSTIDNNISSYYKNGPTESNNKYSWVDGEFNGGEFYKSDWENGEFNGGKFYYSKFYNGVINNGEFGDITTETQNTRVYSATIENVNVNNAEFIAGSDFNTSGRIEWNNGIFNDGIIGVYSTQSSVVWEDGQFNGGEFTDTAEWKNGEFNGGKFTSYYGLDNVLYDNIPNSNEEFAWQDGIFNGGEFGNGDYITNSNWATGEFNGGIFKGRIWKNGVFKAGEFNGSGTFSPVGGYSVDGMTESNANTFVQSFTNSFYGYWNDGYFTDVKDKFVKDKKVFTIRQRTKERKPRNIASFNNALWNSGTFSHPSGEFNNSVWLDGTFESGKFYQSSFNPWVKRDGLNYSFNLNDDLETGLASCIWKNGNFEDSDFYISQWDNGRFLSGTAFGMIFRGGVSNYMNAYNIVWEDGTWRNGNWFGSYMDFNGCVEDDFNKQLLYRVMDYNGTASAHIWNVLIEDSGVKRLIDDTSLNISLIREAEDVWRDQRDEIAAIRLND
jgi:hypothetical protein